MKGDSDYDGGSPLSRLRADSPPQGGLRTTGGYPEVAWIRTRTFPLKGELRTTDGYPNTPDGVDGDADTLTRLTWRATKEGI